MANEQDPVEIENNETEEDLESEVESDVDDAKEPEPKPKEKAIETDEARLARLERQTAQQRKKMGLDVTKSKSTDEPKAKKSDSFDYGEKAFLNGYGIKGADELALVKSWSERTGDSLDSLVTDEIFQSKLGGLRDAKKVADATPKGNKRQTQSSQNDVQYWLDKDFSEVPAEMKSKVLDARITQEKTKGTFSSNPIVFGSQQ